jgi:carboxyl-terminal processing protease
VVILMRIRPVVYTITGAALIVGATGFFLEERSAREGARLFGQVLNLVQDRFVDSVGFNALYEKAAHGLVSELNDPYSELLSPKQLKQFTTTTGGQYGGVGMMIEPQEGAIVISRVYPHTPAERAGIREGDRIAEIEGLSIRGWTTAQVSERMQGVPETQVRVRFARPGVPVPIDVTFTRAVIRIPAVPYAIMLDGNIGYIPLQTFNGTSAAEIRAQVARLHREGAKGLVLDLRRNQGGYLDQALEVSDLFLQQGQEIVSVRHRAEPPEIHRDRESQVAPNVPMVILTDGGSASASEIVAGALQDHDRALLVGTTTFGKGLVQTMYQLDDGWALKITTGKWYTPSGRSIHKDRSPDAVNADTIEDADVSKRPVFKSDAGRTVYGGGAITPDLIVLPDTITTAERLLAQKLVAKSQEVYTAISDYALTLKDGVRPDFVVQPAWRDELFTRIRSKGVDVTKAEWDAGMEYIDRNLANRVAHLAFGDSTAKRREITDDAQLVKALELLRRGRTQQELFAIAAAAQAARPQN